MAQIARTRLSRKDLRDIGKHIARESQSLDVAERFLESIEDKCALYATRPELGELCPDLGKHVRRFSVGS
jgi:plasmid stabilization system protein ParE